MSGKVQHVLKSADGKHWIDRIAFSPDGKVLASGGTQGKVLLWDTLTGKASAELPTQVNWVGALCFAPHGPILAVGDSDGLVWLWDFSRLKLVRCLRGHVGEIHSIAFSRDGKCVATGGSDHTVRLWEPTNGCARSAGSDLVGSVLSINMSANGRTGLMCSVDGTVRLWDVPTGRQRTILVSPKEWCTCIAMPYKSTTLFIGHRDGVLDMWDFDKRVKYGDICQNARLVRKVCCSSDGRYVAALAGSMRTPLLVFRELLPLASEGSGVQHGQHALAESREIVTPRLLRERVYTTLALSPQGDLLVATNGMTVFLWNTVSGDRLCELTGHQSEVTALCFSPDGRIIASGDDKGQIRFGEAATGKVARVWNSAEGRIGAIAWSPGGSLVVAGDSTHSIRVWDWVGGKCAHVLHGHCGAITAFGFAADGYTFVSASADTTGLVWALGKSVEPVRALPDQLTAAEETELWLDLSNSNAERAFRAMWRLVALRDQGVRVIKSHLAPLTGGTKGNIRRLVGELDDPRFTVRREATERLGQFGPGAARALREALMEKPSLEARRRMEMLLRDVDHPPFEPGREELVQVRAVQVLEQIRSCGARELLGVFSRGLAEGWLTRAAKAALERMANLPENSL
jgi:WD40 repeat protein